MTAPGTLIHQIEQRTLRAEPLPEFRSGDTVKVWVKIREGQKIRSQAFEGVCIRRSRGGNRGAFTVRKVSYGVGVERIFADNSPNIEKIEVVSRGRVRQARLYYLRALSGKAARIKERSFDSKDRAQRDAEKKPRRKRRNKDKDKAAPEAAQ
jgi:large subunit ribosomal protein L19